MERMLDWIVGSLRSDLAALKFGLEQPRLDEGDMDAEGRNLMIHRLTQTL